MDQNTLLYILAAVLMVLGLAGTVLPALPGLPLMFAGMLLAAWTDGFERIGMWMLILLGVLTVLSFVIDLMATAMGAKRVGASRKATIGAVLGTFAGLFFGLVGIFIGPFIGAVLGELSHRRALAGEDVSQAAKVGLGTWLGIVFGVVLKLALAFTMLGIFLLAWFL